MRPLTICVLGGTGFVGSYLLGLLARQGHSLRVPTRNRDRHRDLLVLPGVELLAADVHDPAVLAALVRGCDAVVNLVGILNERGSDGTGFDAAHPALARALVAACRSAGVTRLLQVSALRAGPDAPSHYLRSKGEAERIVREESATIAWTIFRPSVIFGPGDSLMNRFAGLLRLFPVLPLARADARFAPVYVGDVTAAIVRALADPHTQRRTYELGGPEVITLGSLVRYAAAVLGLRRVVFGLPDGLGRLQALLMQWLPGKPLSLDNFRSLGLDSIPAADGLAELGIRARSLRSVVPGYLHRPRQPGYGQLAAGD